MKRTLLLSLAAAVPVIAVFVVAVLVVAGLAEARSRRGGPIDQLPLGPPIAERPGPPGAGDPGGRIPPPGDDPLANFEMSFRPPERRVARDHVVVRFAPEMPEWQRRQIVAAAGGADYRRARRDRFARVDVAPGDSVAGLLSRLHGVPGVVSAEPDPLCWAPALRVRAVPARAAAAAADFTDPLFSLQWTLQRIRLVEAAGLNSTGGDGVIVAVIDTGVASGGGSAFPGRRGLDLADARFLPGLDLVNGGPPFDEGSGTNDPASPRFGHGTFVASQIAAGVDNGISGAGVAPRVTILPIRVLGLDGSGTFSDVAEGIDFAVAQGAKVINMSLGGSEGADFLQAAVRRAVAAGVVVVAASGNEADDPDPPSDVAFPARYPEVIAVGASGFDDRRADYSNPGPNLEMMAPAGNDAGADVGNGLPDGAVAPSFVHFPVSGNTVYGTFSGNGTSFSAPQVAGGVALLVALGIDDPKVIRDLLRITDRDLAAIGFDNDTGHGLLDLLEAHRGLGFSF